MTPSQQVGKELWTHATGLQRKPTLTTHHPQSPGHSLPLTTLGQITSSPGTSIFAPGKWKKHACFSGMVWCPVTSGAMDSCWPGDSTEASVTHRACQDSKVNAMEWGASTLFHKEGEEAQRGSGSRSMAHSWQEQDPNDPDPPPSSQAPPPPSMRPPTLHPRSWLVVERVLLSLPGTFFSISSPSLVHSPQSRGKNCKNTSLVASQPSLKVSHGPYCPGMSHLTLAWPMWTCSTQSLLASSPVPVMLVALFPGNSFLPQGLFIGSSYHQEISSLSFYKLFWNQFKLSFLSETLPGFPSK